MVPSSGEMAFVTGKTATSWEVPPVQPGASASRKSEYSVASGHLISDYVSGSPRRVSPTGYAMASVGKPGWDLDRQCSPVGGTSIGQYIPWARDGA